MNTRSGIAAAYALPFQRASEAVRAFWPLVVMWVLAYIAVFALVSSLGPGPIPQQPAGGGLTVFAALFVAFLYALLLAARGAVSWHRMMILGEPMPWTPFVPGRSGLKYAGWIILLSIVFAIAFGFASSLLVGPFVSSFLQAEPTEAMILRANLIAQPVAFLIYGAVLAALAGVVLVLPCSAVEANHAPPADGTVRWILLATALPISFAIAVIEVLVGSGFLLDLVLLVLSVYASLVALTGLSVAFLAARD